MGREAERETETEITFRDQNQLGSRSRELTGTKDGPSLPKWLKQKETKSLEDKFNH